MFCLEWDVVGTAIDAFTDWAEFNFWRDSHG
jgi:hypothetical protein